MAPTLASTATCLPCQQQSCSNSDQPFTKIPPSFVLQEAAVCPAVNCTVPVLQSDGEDGATGAGS